MPQRQPAIRRRILPPVPLTIKHDDGTEIILDLAITNAALARIEERTGIDTLNDILALWKAMGRRSVLNAAFWAACLEYQPDYDSDRGFRDLVSHLDPTNEAQVSDALWQAYCRWAGPQRAEQLEKIKQRAVELMANGESEDPRSPTAEMKAAASSDEKQAGSSCTPSPATTPASATRANSAS